MYSANGVTGNGRGPPVFVLQASWNAARAVVPTAAVLASGDPYLGAVNGMDPRRS